MIDLNPNVATALLQTIAARMDADPGPARLRLYTGPKPAPGGDLTGGQILLGSVNLAKPFAASINGSQLQPATIPNMMLEASGTAAWARFVGGDGIWVWDCLVGDESSQAFIRITGGLTLLAGGLVIITAGLLTIA